MAPIPSFDYNLIYQERVIRLKGDRVNGAAVLDCRTSR